MFGGHCKEISFVSCDIHRLLSLGSRLDPIEITFDAEGFVQPSSILQVQLARVMDFDPNLQMRRLSSLSLSMRSIRVEKR